MPGVVDEHIQPSLCSEDLDRGVDRLLVSHAQVDRVDRRAVLGRIAGQSLGRGHVASLDLAHPGVDGVTRSGEGLCGQRADAT